MTISSYSQGSYSAGHIHQEAEILRHLRILLATLCSRRREQSFSLHAFLLSNPGTLHRYVRRLSATTLILSYSSIGQKVADSHILSSLQTAFSGWPEWLLPTVQMDHLVKSFKFKRT
jgi:hypothetical protein